MSRIFIIKEFRCRLPIVYVKRYKSFCAKYNTKEVESDVGAFDRTNKKLFPNVKQQLNEIKFNTILPPPNVTGNLHLGHAMMITVLDVICRWKHLNGYNVELVPGLDHAGIATQVVVEQQLKRETGLSRFDIGKAEFVEKVLKWKDEKGGGIKADILKMGTIFNWEKEYFTMDKRQSFAVAEAFIRLFDEGVIYRTEALVNWSFALKSTISDIEVDNIEINGPTKIPVPGYEKEILFGEIYNISYQTSNENEFITVATTRPETILGDTAVAVNPNDERYAHLLCKNTRLWHPFRNEWIPLIPDESVNAEFGTGAVKVTPAHSKTDFEIAQRHNLPLIPVIDQNGLIHGQFNEFAKLPRFIARERILDTLANMNLFLSKANHKLDLPICSRSKDIIELIAKPQWFLKSDKMSTQAIDAVKSGRLVIEPSRFEHEWNRWFENTIDWCLSRQIWWGHQIPAYHCTNENQSIWIAAHTMQEARNKAAKQFGITSNMDSEKIQIKQDEDVLDTWFSSGILPFSLHGWPKIENITSGYPLDVLVSGHDILLFWIARMVMLSIHFQNDVPFRTAFLHGIICDDQGKKMSKSRGNVVTPDQVINGASLKELKDDLKKLHQEGILSAKELTKSLQTKEQSYPKGIPLCGIDALRFTLCFSDVREHFIKFDPNDCEKIHRFLNKIWNATKFTLTNCNAFSVNSMSNPVIESDQLSSMDKWILSRLSNTIMETSASLDSLNVGCASLWKTFFYENLCDVYVEAAKYNFQNQMIHESQIQCEILKTCLTIGLRNMGIFTPFLSNELLTYLPHQMEFQPEKWIDDTRENEVNEVLEVCSEIRKIKRDQIILKKHSPRSYLFSTDSKMLKILSEYQTPINSLTFSLETNILPIQMDTFDKREQLILSSIFNEKCSIAISTDVPVQLIDIQERNKKKLAKLQENLSEMQNKILTDKYRKKAKPHTKERDLAQIREIEAQIQTLIQLIEKQ